LVRRRARINAPFTLFGNDGALTNGLGWAANFK
jgi:hypothetical protein